MIQKLCKTALLLGALVAAPVFAQDATVTAQPAPNSGDSAWLLTASALVMLLTVPGLALFYGGMVRARNWLSVTVQIGAVAVAASLVWIVIGYSLAFSVNGTAWLGSAEHFMFNGLLDVIRDDQSTGELVFALFQTSLAMLAPALIVGAWAERARFGWVVAFGALWTLLVYVPVVRWNWGGGFLEDAGVIDYAGGIVIHVSAGVSALVAALAMGKRAGFGSQAIRAHNPALRVVGAGLLWAGWMGISGGWALSASAEGAAAAIINTHLSACASALVWILLERITTGKVSATGFATGLVAGLVAISAGAGVVGPGGALLIGVIAAVVCYYVIAIVAGTLKIDDTLNVFAISGAGGMTGALLLAVFASTGFGGVGYDDGAGVASQLWLQLKAIAIVTVWSAVVTLIIGYMIAMVLPMRVRPDQEEEGLDIASHGESAV